MKPRMEEKYCIYGEINVTLSQQKKEDIRHQKTTMASQNCTSQKTKKYKHE